jgi:hypothetical protein
MFDGKVKKEIFTPSFQDHHHISWEERSTERSTAQADVDENLLGQRLRSLGYL